MLLLDTERPGLLGFAITYVLANVVPLITAWIFRAYNKATTWLGRQSTAVKMTVYVLGTTALVLAFNYVGLAFTPGQDDPTNLSAATVEAFIKALIGTLLVKVGIQTEQTRLSKKPRTRKANGGNGLNRVDDLKEGGAIP